MCFLSQGRRTPSSLPPSTKGALLIALIEKRPGNGAKSPDETSLIIVPPQKKPVIFQLSFSVV